MKIPKNKRSEINPLHAQDFPVLQEHPGHGDIAAEAGTAAAAGIQPQAALDFFRAVPVRMAADDRLHTFQIAGNIPGIMCHQEGNACDGEAQDAGQVTQALLP